MPANTVSARDFGIDTDGASRTGNTDDVAGVVLLDLALERSRPGLLMHAVGTDAMVHQSGVTLFLSSTSEALLAPLVLKSQVIVRVGDLGGKVAQRGGPLIFCVFVDVQDAVLDGKHFVGVVVPLLARQVDVPAREVLAVKELDPPFAFGFGPGTTRAGHGHPEDSQECDERGRSQSCSHGEAFNA